MEIELATDYESGARLKVIGVGGGGGNAVNNMIARDLKGIEFIIANTDAQDLKKSPAPLKIQIGKETTKGKGAGADPAVGRVSAEEDIKEVIQACQGGDMIFVTCGMGGGTGTGGAPIIAKAAKESGALVVGIATKPFEHEGNKKMLIAEEGIKQLRQNVDSLIVISNEKLFDIIDENSTIRQAFSHVDDVLYNATKCISDIVLNTGIINVDFADITTIMKDSGDSLMGIGTAKGEHRAIKAIQSALNSPLLEGVSINGAKAVLVNFEGGSDMSITEVKQAMKIVQSEAAPDATIIKGVVNKEEAMEDIIITVIATRFEKKEEEKIFPSEQKKHAIRNDNVQPKYSNNNTPRGIFSGSSVAETNGSVQRPIEYQGYNTPLPGDVSIKVPRGDKELRDKDTPPTLRRSADNNQSYKRVGQLIDNSNNSNGNRHTNNNIPRDILTKPACIRKMSD